MFFLQLGHMVEAAVVFVVIVVFVFLFVVVVVVAVYIAAVFRCAAKCLA